MLPKIFSHIKAVLTCSLLLFVFASSQAQPSNGQTSKTEILWDNYGVPHIYANSSAEMYYAFGWSQMHSHGNLVLQLYAQARGRAAEYLGEAFRESDKQIRLFNLPEQAAKTYALQRPGYKSYLDAFVRGLNDYAQAHPGELRKELHAVLPVKGLRRCQLIVLTPPRAYCSRINAFIRLNGTLSKLYG